MLQDEDNSREWFEIIKNAQEADDRIRQELTNPETDYRERDGLVRRIRINEEKITVPDTVAWRLVESIHKF